MTLVIYCLIFSLYFASVQCGWVYSVEQQFCYQIVDQPKTWQEARGYCQQNGGDLLSISKGTEQNFFQAVLSTGKYANLSYFWIGATDNSNEGKWSWTDNTPFLYTNWTTGEPNNLTGENCGEIAKGWSYTWNDAKCTSNKSAICKKTCMCGLGWLYSVETNFCYQIDLKQNMTWQAAREYCQQNGGDLLSISGVKEQNSIEAMFSTAQYDNVSVPHRYWIGATDNSSEGIWSWTDNTPFWYSKWNVGEPSNTSKENSIENCAEMLKVLNYTWNEINCGDFKYPRGFICKKNLCSSYVSACDVMSFCVNTSSGSCQCTSGYSGDGQICKEIDECTSSVGLCDVNAVCTNTVGSYTCRCKTGYTGNGKNCTDVNECSSGISPCNVNANCTNTAGSFTCQCKSGYTGNGQTCTDVNECSSGISPCSVYANCTNTGGSFTCQCKSGYTGNGQTCTDVNECSSGISPCNVNANCTNTVGSFTCQYNSGYTENGQTCTVQCGWVYSVEQQFCYQIVNQPKTWQEARGYCQQNGGDLLSISKGTEQSFLQAVLSTGKYANLSNFWIGATDNSTEGKWSWTDNTPFVYTNWTTGEPNNLTGENCGEVVKSWTYKWNDAICTSNKSAICKKTCMCGLGWLYSVETNFCYQIDLKHMTWQAAREYCQQNGGNLLSISGVKEQNFIEAMLSTAQYDNVSVPHRYWIGATDNSSEGIWSWTDNTPFRYSKWTVGGPSNTPKENCAEMLKDLNYAWNDVNCDDFKYPRGFICKKNLCSSYVSACDVISFCVNTSSGSCKCTSGYSGDGQICTDIDECTSSVGLCDVNANCTNTVGSYTCRCKTGYTGNGNKCTDVNECSSGISPCSVYANCTNTVGSFTCQCKSGYTGNGQTCTDVNECSSGISPCSVYANCTNTLGSFTCQCKSGYTGNGQTCTGCDETPSIMFGTATLDDPNNSTFGATANVTCDFGFKPARTSITCLRTGKWETGYCIAKVLISPLCGLSWIYSVKNNVCYQIGIEQAKTWQAAREYCHQDGGDLLSISGVTEQNIIQAVLRNGQYANLENVYWIGATDQDKEGEWNWTDNTTFGYVNWHIGEPNNVSGTEDCAEIRLGPYWNYQWNGGNCDTEQNFICKKKSLDTKPATLPTHTDATIVTETVKSLPIVAIAAGAGGAGAAILVIIIVIVVCVCRKRNSAKASNGNKSTERCDIPDDGYIALAASGIRSPDSPPRKPEQIEEEKYHYLDESAMVDMSKLRVDISPIPPDRKDNPSGNENYNDGYLTASNTLITDPRPDYPKQDEYSNNTSDGYLVASSVGSRESGSGITNPAFRQINNGFL